jgi:hypothetical protein
MFQQLVIFSSSGEESYCDKPSKKRYSVQLNLFLKHSYIKKYPGPWRLFQMLAIPPAIYYQNLLRVNHIILSNRNMTLCDFQMLPLSIKLYHYSSVHMDCCRHCHYHICGLFIVLCYLCLCVVLFLLLTTWLLTQHMNKA